MANYQPVAQSESSAADLLLAGETFANVRDQSDANEHHKEPDGRRHNHHLLNQSVSNASQKQGLFRIGANDSSKLKNNANQLPFNATAPSNDTSSPASFSKPNVTFKLSDEPESKVLLLFN